jgi:hypothetical protein
MREGVMGFESFRVELRGGRASLHEAETAIRQVPFSRPDNESLPTAGSTHYVIDDSRHVIEIELRDAPVRVSCRFTLCHPLSIDEAFLGVIHDLMTRLQMQASICDDVRPEHSRPFSLDEFAEFATATSGYATVRRKEWVAAFGDKPMAASTSEVHQRIILPQCTPVARQPT